VNRELTFVCDGRFAVHVNPVTSMAWFDTDMWPAARRLAMIEEGSIIVGTDAGGTMQIRRKWERKGYIFTEWSDKRELKSAGTCALVP
jgi:hypothetical protein